MIRLICFLFCIFIINNVLFSQGIPKLFNYQIAVRNVEGSPISNRMMNFQVSIADNPNNNNYIFRETYNQKTNSNGIANFQIGSRKAVGSVSLNEIPFLQHDYYISIAVDTNNGANYKHISTTQLISVPYAMVADSANYARKVDQLSQNGASNGQVLKWNSSLNKWGPSNDIGGGVGDNWGGQSAVTNAPLGGNGTVSSPITLNQNGATNGQVLKWNNSSNKWEPSNDIGGGVGDNWGGQSAVTNAPLSGNGTISSPLTISSNGVNNGQILKWNSSMNKWVPSNDLEGSTGGFTHYIGELYGGGIVFYVYKDKFNMEHGLIASLDAPRYIWSNIDGLTNAKSTWDGSLNTMMISSQSIDINFAANAALNYSKSTFTDWYLPSIDELSLLSNARFLLNKSLDTKNNPSYEEISLNKYWSSSESGIQSAWYFSFGENQILSGNKTTSYSCRFIRQF